VTGPFELVPVEGLSKKSPGQLVDLILAQLSEPEREMFIPCEVEGFSLAETATPLRVSEKYTERTPEGGAPRVQRRLGAAARGAVLEIARR